MAADSKCPVCDAPVVVEEDWALGRVTRCGIHYRKVERFDRRPAPHLLDKQEKGEQNAA